MSRPPRIISKTGMYHVVFRGINRQNLFEEEKDFEKLLNIIDKTKKEFEFELYAYCFMTNHVHLFIKEKNAGDIKAIMHKLLSVYASWYNFKYQRSGSLIANRYKSEPVENEKYYLALIRYIHQNPLKAGITKELKDYLWSSYNAYLATKRSHLIDVDFALSLYGKNRKTAIKEFIEFHNMPGDDNFELSEKIRLNDEQLKRKMLEITKVQNLSDIAVQDKNNRNIFLIKMREEGISIRDIERLTGISRGVIYRSTKAKA